MTDVVISLLVVAVVFLAAAVVFLRKGRTPASVEDDFDEDALPAFGGPDETVTERAIRENWTAAQVHALGYRIELVELPAPLTPEELELADRMKREKERLKRVLSAPWVMESYKYSKALDKQACLDILVALLEIGRPASRAEVLAAVPSISHNSWLYYVRRLKTGSLIVVTGAARGMKYAVNPDRVEPLSELLLAADNEVAA